MRKVVFIGGIHGVGKSYLCELLKEKTHLNIYSASELIRIFQKDQTDINKRVPNINKNQDVLITAIEENVPENICLVLDGHFCLLDSNQNIKRIPYSTFEQLNIIAIITLVGEPNIIKNRLNLRDNSQYTENFISDFQDSELNYSKDVAKKLHVNHLTYDIQKDNIDTILDYLNNNLGKDKFDERQFATLKI
ncbi:ATP-binding protein [Ruminiclostridium josui]|uniref:ATP-binding protein n=1 Tax=Ruminiclostridium josui TaxID=1499 RepID=UPI000465F72F|nr:ATP-binding protein [Ruminiclostridium josui]